MIIQIAAVLKGVDCLVNWSLRRDFDEIGRNNIFIIISGDLKKYYRFSGPAFRMPTYQS
jgi:hypothetical protein